MRSHAEILGFTQPGHYVWCARQWGRLDPSRPVKKWDTAWRNLRAKAGLPKLRFHDLHHTIITELAEAGVPDHVMDHQWAPVAPNAGALLPREITGQEGSAGRPRRST